MSDKNFRVSEASNKRLTIKNPSDKLLRIKNKNFRLDFSKCDVDKYPTDKKSFKAVIELLRVISNSTECKDLCSVGYHPLCNKGNGKESAYIKKLIRENQKIFSLDVFHRGGSNGNIRLLYAENTDYSCLLHILNCYIDDHY